MGNTATKTHAHTNPHTHTNTAQRMCVPGGSEPRRAETRQSQCALAESHVHNAGPFKRRYTHSVMALLCKLPKLQRKHRSINNGRKHNPCINRGGAGGGEPTSFEAYGCSSQTCAQLRFQLQHISPIHSQHACEDQHLVSFGSEAPAIRHASEMKP